MTATTTLLSGPAGSGKTTAAVGFALERARAGERVIVLTLPNQRDLWLERLAAGGASVGVEVTNLQNVCYRMLDRLGENRAVVLNPGRVALTARALEAVLARPINPGEARLYARAIAECKRFDTVPPESADPYQRTLAGVFSHYQQLLEDQGLQDLDDVRTRATNLLNLTALPLRAHLIVDGYRALVKSELEAIKTLSEIALSALVTLPGGAPDTGHEAWAHPTRASELEVIAQKLNARRKRLEGTGKPWSGLPVSVNLRVHPNPVSEARGVLRQIKQALHDGERAQSMAIVVPNPAAMRVLEALAKEYAVPVAPETLGSLLETPEGRVLDALLGAGVRDYPARELRTLARLEPALLRLADTLESRGIAAGAAAYPLLSDDPEALDALLRIQRLGAPPVASETRMLEWFEGLLESVVTDTRLRDSARVTAREAARILGGQTLSSVALDGAVFSDWLRSLLGSVTVPHPDAGRGVAVLSPEEISGRRYNRVFVTNAVDGAYRSGEPEDFFIPEDERRALSELLRGTPGLPERLVGLEDSTLYDVLTRADDATNLSYPRAERGSSLRPHPRLAQLGARLETDPPVTASHLELTHARAGNALEELLESHEVGFQEVTRATDLERFAVCGVRAWAEARLPAPRGGSGLVPGDLLDGWARRQRSNLWRNSGKSAAEVAPEEHKPILEKLSPAFRVQLEASVESRVPPLPDVTGIKLAHKEMLEGIEYVMDGVRLREDPSGKVRLVEIYRVVDNVEEGYEALMQENRHREWWFAQAWLNQGVLVNLMVMDFRNPPKRPFDLSKPYAQRRLETANKTLERVREDLQNGVVRASPGFHCRVCSYRDLCRVAD